MRRELSWTLQSAYILLDAALSHLLNISLVCALTRERLRAGLFRLWIHEHGILTCGLGHLLLMRLRHHLLRTVVLLLQGRRLLDSCALHIPRRSKLSRLLSLLVLLLLLLLSRVELWLDTHLALKDLELLLDEHVLAHRLPVGELLQSLQRHVA